MSYDGVFLDNSTVRFERLLPGPIERVWDYLTKSEYLETWLAGAEANWRPGGEITLAFTFSAQDECSDSICKGIVQDYDPPRLLSYSWREFDPQGREKPASVVRFELAEEGDQIRLVLTHRKLSRAEMPGFGAGWDSHLHYLAARIAGQPVRPFPEIFAAALTHYSTLAKQ
ncbi:MAG: SRPBCC family protein [Parvibaculaceae bacterium]